MSVESIITENLDIWTSAIKAKSASGRGSSNKIEFYGLKKLRELILQLAVRGKLVPQNSSEESAEKLLKKIKDAKKQLVDDKKLPKGKAKLPVSEEVYPYKLPTNWKFINLTEVYYPISSSGKKLKKTEISEEGLYPVIDQGQEFISGYTNNESLLIKIPNDVIVFGDHTRNLKLVNFDFVAGADGTKILCPILVEPSFFYLSLCSYDLENRGYGRHFKILNDNFFALPPLEEQTRIVTKVKHLLLLCDQLESQTEASVEAHQTLVKSLLETLTIAKDADELNESWQRISEHFDVLFTTEDSIDQLKQTILQLAVMGKLVKQDPNDEPASKLLERIAAEKEQLIKDKKIKKQKPLPPVSEDEKPFALPFNWSFCRLSDLEVFSGAGWSPQCLPTKREGDSWGVLKVSAVTWDVYKPEENKELPAHLEPRPELEVKSNDFLISRANTADLVAKAVVVPELSPQKLMMSDKIVRFQFHECVNANYLNLVNNSKFSRDYYNSVAGGTSSSMKNVSREQIRSLVVPLPPSNEQIKILQKVEEISVFCEALKSKLRDSSKVKIHLADCLMKLEVEETGE